MSYSKNICEKIEKYKSFFNDDTPGQILVIIPQYTFEIDYSPLGFEKKPLNAWNFEKDVKDFMNRQVTGLKYFLEYTKELNDDYIPQITGAVGIGSHSAYFSGADIIIGEDTSWVHPVINEWEDIKRLSMNSNTKWMQILRYMAECNVELCDGSYIPGTFGHFAPADMANALRGNELFYDFYDYPEKVHELMDISVDAIVWLQEELKKIVGHAMGGSAVAGMWFPGNVLFLSEDAPDLCSPDIYKEFCAPYTQKVIDRVGGAYIHHHAKGAHIHKEIAKLNGLKTLEISWDPNCPRPIDHIEEIIEWNNGLPLMIRCTADDVYQNIDKLKKGRIIIMLNIDSLEEGKEAVRFVRKHSRI